MDNNDPGHAYRFTLTRGVLNLNDACTALTSTCGYLAEDNVTKTVALKNLRLARADAKLGLEAINRLIATIETGPTEPTPLPEYLKVVA